MRTVFWVAVIIFLSDQATKYYVVHMLSLDRVLAINVWDPYFNLRMAWNYGINFGLLSLDSAEQREMMRWVLIGVALTIAAAVLWWIYREPGSLWHRIAAGFLVGGALGNVVDRVLYGAVADFINMSCCGVQNPYAFNIADIAVFIGAFGLVVLPHNEKAA
ncbi:signal peptidase II [Roseovarius faecimaris]|uniref:Lipoprotein signal peptidase n=1 Tax=Roseovarius faecimaris TaxID=2494550 RepID=A0A6I6IWG3_9RHOB|nr:signal peptidase II [Roseovarius faecimaris]QGX99786.1 signal peptidase II [Roseovarius faecimaris]